MEAFENFSVGVFKFLFAITIGAVIGLIVALFRWND